MKVIVPVKRVIDYNVKARIKKDQSGIDLSNVKMSMNPFCEIAVEEAVRLKESGIASEVLVVSIGDKSCQEQIRTALALGADRGIQIETDNDLDSLQIAKILKVIVDEEKPKLVILGKQAIDSDNNQTGQMLGALTKMPQGTFASNVDANENQVLVTREIDGGLQTVSLTLPAIITTDLRLNEPRYAKLPDIMKAKRKPITVRNAEELGIDLSSKVKTILVEEPPTREGGVKVEDIEMLIQKLREEAKVI
ncbi:electron transfer flavoprotein subunit beta/FixA family protein [Glaciecola petra]|uniref:Electron transfer flavoprotein subunit beta n=1 Tax=Glaciecola petra TaxID=3075602 RepID=A0ABU2ZUZ1_9ALTE|nr:electron transfer flavoprotein subunit beta/FixA family protein [Aestuariibacter sp. P117]MDT0596457.1 electron transfer flavoprotein subunit beta/FixA family protein [Aestuariibacter sp. P117]